MANERLPGAAKACVVMVVEDECVLRSAVVEELRDYGFDVVEAANADDAITLFNAGRKIDIVFSDMNMPGSMDGAGLAKWLRSKHPTIKVVLASGAAQFLEGTSHLCERFFTKPYGYGAMAKYFRSLLPA